MMVYTAAQTLMCNAVRSRPPTNPGFAALQLVLLETQPFLEALFASRPEKLYSASHRLTKWSGQLKAQLDRGVTLAGGYRAYIDANFEKFFVAANAMSAATYDPVESLTAIINELCVNLASKMCKTHPAVMVTAGLPQPAQYQHQQPMQQPMQQQPPQQQPFWQGLGRKRFSAARAPARARAARPTNSNCGPSRPVCRTGFRASSCGSTFALPWTTTAPASKTAALGVATAAPWRHQLTPLWPVPGFRRRSYQLGAE